MKLLALKIDVDTLRGTLEGARRLAQMLREHQARATFLYSMGPDHTGRAMKRVFRRGFLNKVSRTSVVEHYGLKTLLYGVLLPGPDIGRRAADAMREVRNAGFETGLHAWDHVKWHDGVRTADARWTRREWQAAADRYIAVFGTPARVSGAAGWQINEETLRLQSAGGIEYASDGRGPRPYRLSAGGVPVGPPQYPTTLPTLDEVLGTDGLDERTVHRHLLALTERSDPNLPQVFTLHAELEGQKLLPVFERLIAGWREQGWELVDLRTVHQAWHGRELPVQPLQWGQVPGRAGELVVSH
jgi:undecaprenyl phosphate-alpha-L-ara4FN deformylase